MTIADRIRIRREQLNLTQEELAVKCGYAGKSSISKIEKSGDDITLKKIQRVASVLGVSHRYLMGWEDDDLLNVSDRSDFLNSFTHEEENILRKIRELEKYYSIPEIERALDFIALYQKAIPEIQMAIDGLLKSQKHDS